MSAGQSFKAQLAEGYQHVFRYYCAWVGDPAQAQAQAEYALQQAWIHRDQFTGKSSSFLAWLLGLARYLRKFHAHKAQSSLTSQTTDTYDARLLLSLARLSILLPGLPAAAAEALVLMEIAGLSLPDTAAALAMREKNASQVRADGLAQLLALWKAYPSEMVLLGNPERSDDLATGLAAMAQNLHPAPDWWAQMQLTLESAEERKPGLVERLQIHLPYPRRYRLRLAVSWMLRIAPLLALLTVVAFLAWPAASPVPVVPTILPPTPAPRVSFVNPAGSQVGYLVPPASDTCQAWQTRLENEFNLPATLQMEAPFSNPVLPSDAPSGKGRGCRIEVVGDLNLYPQMESAFQAISGLLENQGVKVTPFRCDTCRANNFMFGEYWRGDGRAIHDGDEYVLLTLAWRPLDPDACTSGLECQPPMDEREFALRLTQASGAAQGYFKTFFDAWVRGDPDSLDSLAPALRERITGIADLDHLAGFNRAPSDALRLTWQVVENTGSRIRLTIQASPLAKPILPAQSIAPFQVEWVRSGGRWLVNNLGPGILFPFSSDTVYWTDADGTVYRYSLGNQTTQALTPTGAYQPQPSPDEAASRVFPQISPDGRWLVLDQTPGGSLPPATLLIDQMQPGQAVRLPRLATLAWSVDSKHLAIVTMDDLHSIQLLSLPFIGQGQKLVSFSDILAAIAWSPDGKNLAVVTSRLVETPVQTLLPTTQRVLSIVELDTGATRSLGNLGDSINPGPQDLAWARQGQEIWYFPAHAAFNVASGRLMPLATYLDVRRRVPDFPSTSWVAMLNRDAYPLLGMSGQGALSPNLRWIAILPSDFTGNMIILNEADNQQNNLWNNAIGSGVSLTWTHDSGSLIAGPVPGQAGRIVRLLASTGEGQVLANSVYWIGVGSDMLSRSHSQLADAVQIPLTPTDKGQDWPCHTMGNALECLRLPPDWNITEAPGNNFFLMKAENFQIQNTLGWTSLLDEDRFLTIRFDWSNDPSLNDFILGDFFNMGGGNSWDKISIQGYVGIRFILPAGQSTAPEEILIPRCNGLLSLDILPSSAYNDPDIQRILNSIRFLPCP